MVFACHRHTVAAAVLLLFCSAPNRINANTITTAPKPIPTVNAPATCEFRTINYITDSLPQQCLRSAWSNANATSTRFEGSEDATLASPPVEGTITSSSSVSSHDTAQSAEGVETLQQESPLPGGAASSTSNPIPSATETSELPSADIYGGELNEASFLSFEDWKKQTLEKAGQQNANIGNKRSSGAGEKKRDSDSFQNNLDSLGDEGEIDLDFGPFRSGGKGEEFAQKSETDESGIQPDSQGQDGATKRKDIYRSKDAGKTCKERFSYASFDAGATVLKTHPGAKNPKAVLIENKDSYMLSECATDNKFIIIELSEDIWIDTLVLANYEFFSSMIRTFRVSVSDRYPVKMEKWKDLGTYEARNSREIQAFLIENPQIWARYLRIEFLSHYGNEYYCPLSLVRVHGTRMLESWKETEANGDEDDNDEHGTEEHFVLDAVADVVQEEEKLNAERKEAQEAIHEQASETLVSSQIVDTSSSENASSQWMTTSWVKPDLVEMFNQLNSSAAEICQIADAPISPPVVPVAGAPETMGNSTIDPEGSATTIPVATAASPPNPPPAPETPQSPNSPVAENPTHSETPSPTIETPIVTKATSGSQEPISLSAAASATKSQNITSSQKNRTSSTSSAASSLPTIQESFFKAVSRRLQLLETNSTLSLKYIEEQSKILREAFTKVEKKQLQRTNTFLDTLNSTVLAELRGFRQQYDEIWQSTVISLESQRDESRREILAITARLNILADEVVFQKRMSIVQSVLLLLCLGLVIFSRVSATGALDFQSMQMRARNLGFPISPIESPLESPSVRRSGSMRDRGQWLDSDDRRRRSAESPISRPGSRERSPPTPVSPYSTSDNALTPPSGADDNLVGSTGSLPATSPKHLGLPGQSHNPKPSSMPWHERSDGAELTFLSSSSVETPSKRKGYIKQQDSPLASGLDSDLVDDPQSRLEHPVFIQQEQNKSAEGSPRLPSPPPEREKGNIEFSIARKPLPALPHGS